ncbi:hypothetical protein JCGZ_10462 [Jatropha curcas]|uniref:Uncharacterized protein n=1 Tax=Jatropha curcas TaxID=180498 RepID=A0A067JJR8_JATCU|nr:hypothetical protein JCGZ_10462 [Jatropha curcas]
MAFGPVGLLAVQENWLFEPQNLSIHTFRNQVSSIVQSIPDDLWQIHPMNQLAWLKYFKDLKPDHSFLSWLVTYFNPNTMVFWFEDSEVTPTYDEMCAVMGHHPEQDETPALPPGPRHDLAEIAALWPVYLPDGIDPDQGLPLEPFLSRVLYMDVDPSFSMNDSDSSVFINPCFDGQQETINLFL